MGKYVPVDWTGPTTFCRVCGNKAPDVSRTVTDDPDGPRECSRCFIGRVLNEVCSAQEARDLRAEVAAEIKQPTTPWKNQRQEAADV